MRRTAAIALLALVPALTLPAASSYSDGVFDPAPYLDTRWYGVYLFEEKVGYGSFRLTETDYRGISGYLTEFQVDYRLNIGGSLQEMAIREEKIYLPGTGLTAFQVLQDSLLGRVSFSGRREGEQFLIETPTGERTAPAAGETLAGALAHLELVRNGSGPGDAVTVRQFETTLLVPVTVTHTVETVEKRFPGGVPLKLYRVRSEFSGLGLATSSLIDGELRTIEGKLGIITIREEEEAAARDLDSPGDLLLAAAVRPDRPLPRPRKIRSLALRLSGLADPTLALSSPRQVFERIGEDTYYLRVSSPPAPRDPPPRIPVSGDDFLPDLEATAYIQSDHPAIRQQAREIVEDGKDSRRAAELLTDWVFRNLKKSFLAAIPNAVDVLEERSGDCKAHSTLLVALARSLGLPARTVSGLVAMEDGLFYYHQWAEIFTGEWTPADPVFGQIPVDAAHISLSRSGPAEQLRLLNLIGRIRIEVLEWGSEKQP
jgi:transglutaminase-like putative cysteine protease